MDVLMDELIVVAVVVAFPNWTLCRSLGICNCTLMNVMGMVTWTATRRLRGFISISGGWMLFTQELIVAEDRSYLNMQRTIHFNAALLCQCVVTRTALTTACGTN